MMNNLTILFLHNWRYSQVVSKLAFSTHAHAYFKSPLSISQNWAHSLSGKWATRKKFPADWSHSQHESRCCLGLKVKCWEKIVDCPTHLDDL